MLCHLGLSNDKDTNGMTFLSLGNVMIMTLKIEMQNFWNVITNIDLNYIYLNIIYLLII